MTPESRLLSERQVAERSGLAGPLVDALIPRLPAAAGGPYHAEAKVFPEESVWQARIAIMLLHQGIRLRFIREVLREPRTCEQLKRTLEAVREDTGSRRTLMSRMLGSSTAKRCRRQSASNAR